MMNKSRLTAFTDAIIAIIMTVMALEIKVPNRPTLGALNSEAAYFSAFVITFLSLGTDWYNHHYAFGTAKKISRKAFWFNLFWLLVMAILPVATGWVSEFPWSRTTEYFYFILFFARAILYYLLITVLAEDNPRQEEKIKNILSNNYHYMWDGIIFIAGLISIYFIPVMGMILMAIHIVLWIFLTPKDSDNIF